jgi:hypothetical protein
MLRLFTLPRAVASAAVFAVLWAFGGCAYDQGPIVGPEGDSATGDPAAGAKVAAAADGRVRFWAVHDADDVEPDGLEAPDSSVWNAARRTVSLAGAPGETVAFQLVLAGDGLPRTGVNVRFAPLSSDAADPTSADNLPASVFKPFRAEWVRVERFRPWYPAESGRAPKARLVADVLSPIDRPMELSGERHQPIFVDVEIPADARPGEYFGRLAVTSEGKPTAEAEVLLRVWPFALPSVSRGRGGGPAVVSRVGLSRLAQWESGYTGPVPPPTAALAKGEAPWAMKARAQVPATLNLLRAHGVRPMLDDLRPAVDFEWPGKANVDWSAYDECLERFLPVRAAADADGQPGAAPALPPAAREPLVAPLSGEFPDPAAFRPPGGSAGTSGDAKANASAFYQQALRSYAEQVAAHYAGMGRLGSAVVLYEAPDGNPATQVARATQFAAVLGELRPTVPVVVPFAPQWARRHAAKGDVPAGTDAVAVLSVAAGAWRTPPAWFGQTTGPTVSTVANPAPTRGQVWLSAGEPPFLASRRVEAPRAGIVSWGWAAFRYRPDALDIGPANPWPPPTASRAAAEWSLSAAGSVTPSAESITESRDGEPAWIYPDGPRPSVRLKLLRRAVQDHLYLQALTRVVGTEKTSALTRALLRYALNDAALGAGTGGKGSHASHGPEDGRFGGWSLRAEDYEQVRRTIGRVIAEAVRRGGGKVGDGAGPGGDWAGGEEFEKLLARQERAELEVVGVRLTAPPPGSPDPRGRLEVRVRVSNNGALPREDLGSLTLAGPGLEPLSPPGEGEAASRAHAAERAELPRLEAGRAFEATLSAATPVPSGRHSFDGTFLLWRKAGVERRVPVRVCRQTAALMPAPPAIDGDLSDWSSIAVAVAGGGSEAAPSSPAKGEVPGAAAAGADPNAATGFVSSTRLDAGEDALGPAAFGRPTVIRAAADDSALYFAVDCGRKAGDIPACRPGNRIGRDGPVLWGEDAVEIVLSIPSAGPASGDASGGKGPAPAASARWYRIAVKRNGVLEKAAGAEGAFPEEPWNADVSAACSPDESGRGERSGAWRAEVRIPWEAIGGRPPAGTCWGVNYVRHVGGTGDTGSWSYSPRHIFRPETLGTLVLP